MHQFTHEIEHSREQITHLEKLSNDFKSAQIYTLQYTGPPLQSFYEFHLLQAQQIPKEIAKLRGLANSEKPILIQLDTLSAIVAKHPDAVTQQNRPAPAGEIEASRLSDLFRAESIVSGMAHKEESRLHTRSGQLDREIFIVNILSILLSLSGFAIIIFTFLNNQKEYRRRLQVEGFLESVLNTSQAGIISLTALRNADGTITDFKVDYANPAIERLTGLRREDLPGRRMADIGPQIRERLFDDFRQVLQTGEHREFEKQFGDRWYYISLAQKGDGITASFQDISAIRQYQKELESSIRQLEQSNAELEEYAYAASHDLQEPLRKIQTFANFIWERKEQAFDEKEKQYFQKLVQSANRMSALVRDLLSMSALRKKPEFVSTDLNLVVAQVIQDLDLLISQKKATLNVGRLPVIEAVPLQMQQLFFNLIHNALKFAAPGRPLEITVDSRQLTADEVARQKSFVSAGPYSEISVCDNGIGFNDQDAKQIFGLFKRLHVQDLYPGSGIGLTLCQRVAENHHGLIYAKGEENKGACFFVVLPEKQEGL